ncbi:Actin interacting protein 3-like C-terminal domain-containing protein [Caenorhabditis elegans]|uniref:Actin interacting protein 3-like C-terminal domain-containing protein n=1 Tax=Caenorhabditis elegans TaxID=6239 RepID=A0ACB0DPE4_CAEEL|nr:Actin interacting protein 3-like C-terminal domain-containing protein [Caenorhabditis elegans]CAI9651032.1 Actin interacting protein 3-like C-terminal domain-containing protein [Caenorhabditis elegans]
MFGCIAPPRQSRSIIRSCSQDSREFHGDPRFQRPASVDLRQPRHPLTTRGRSATPPATLHGHPSQNNKPPKMKRLDKWIGNLLSERGSSGRIPPEENVGSDWRYADDVKVRIDPVDHQRPIDSQPSRFGQHPSRATSVLQNLREQKSNLEYDERRREVSTLPSSYSSNRPDIYGNVQRFDTVSRTESHLSSDSQATRHLDDMNVVFLQANDEVKRILLPRNIHSMHQVKMSFVRTFPNVNRSFVEQPHVKIYIQEPTKGAIFYELEDPGDIKNKSVLRLREKTRVMSPVGGGYLDQPDYHSETEQDDGRRVGMMPMMRPASAMAAPSVDYMHRNTLPLKPQPPPPQVYDIYSDPYNSDTSSHDSRSVTRSGSATPVIDRESRVRMETMERQLAGLSNLVHTALVSKGMSETTQKDMAELRREVNAQTGNTLLREAGDKIGRLVADRMRGGVSVMPIEIPATEMSNESQRNEHASQLAELLHSLTSFETNVETVRGSVLANQKKLRMSEVEDMTEKLTNIGRLAANLKTDFPPIQMAIEQQIKRDMERVVREEKFIRDQSIAVDQSLRRCKALANIMVTMKKLAMVQDPSIQRRKKHVERADSAGAPGSPRLPPKPSVAQTIAMHSAPPSPLTAPIPPPPPPPPPMLPPQQSQLAQSLQLAATSSNVVKVAPMYEYKESPKSPVSDLDNVLEEVGDPGSIPRPPSRYSVQDVRQKFSKPPELPDQLRNLIEDVARRASPGPEQMNDRRQDLEERQERLAEKQRQLRSQFQQLQQLAPLP